MRLMLTRATRQKHRIGCLFLFVLGLGWLVAGGHGAVIAQRPYAYDGYLRLIADFRNQALRASADPQGCLATMTTIADALEKITLVQMPDGTLMRVDHHGVAEALRSRPCSASRADRYLSGLCPDQMCPISRPMPPIRPWDGSSGGDNSLVGVGGSSGAPQPGAPQPGAPPPVGLPPPPALPPGSDPFSPDVDGDAGPSNDPGPTDPPDPLFDPAAGVSGPSGSGQPGSGAPQPAPTPIPTPTPTPPPVASANPDDEKNALSSWLYVIMGLAVLSIVTAVVLLLWPKKEEVPLPRRHAGAAGTAMNEGRRLVEEGDYREAVRRLFLAMLLTLDEQGVMRFDRALTNLELLHQERLQPAIVPALSPVITTYERVWYGLEPLQTEEYDSLTKHIKAIREWRLESHT